ncbi:MAG TPA: 50S ribosomal protein L11 methyltransferase [Clostridiaceae bacterium]|nr:50S ribosomal protein L11 methyltransferase [Clostridiaceae bacterium]
MVLAEVTIETTPAAAEVIVDALSALGAQGTAVKNPADILSVLDEPNVPYEYDDDLIGDPNQVTVKAWFDENALGAEKTATLLSEIKQELARISEFLPIGQGSVELCPVEQANWENAWKAYYQPIVISRRLAISPTWVNFQPQPGQKVIWLDPGGAFGTGAHASTAMSLEWMDTYMLGDSKVLDVGCGSGILSIAAAHIGSYWIDALDVDPIAVETTQENAEANGCAQLIHARIGEMSDLEPNERYDFILMNIVADVIIDLLPQAVRHLRPLGLLFCAGILNTKEEKVRTAIEQAGFAIHNRFEKEEWVAFALSHKK